MNNQDNFFAQIAVLGADWSVFFKLLILAVILLMIAVFIYDRFIQRKNQLLINYPLVGRLRYFFYLIRDPMRQYFGDETYYDSFEKLDWVTKVAHHESPYLSFSTSFPQSDQKILFKHANFVKEMDEVQHTFSVTFGEQHKYPFKTHSIVGRSAMSDGSISPEGTRAFSRGAYREHFPINTGEGGLTSNFLTLMHYSDCSSEFVEKKEGTIFAKSVYKLILFVSNSEIAHRVYRKMVVRQRDRGSFIFDRQNLLFFRIHWSKPLEYYPQEVPPGVPDIVFQMGSGLYGVRDEEGNFDAERYAKVMRFCRMTEIKLAQGAKQTGGKLLASKVSEDIAYYRGVKPHQDLISPNRFPYAQNVEMLFDFVEELQDISEKPVGIKIVVSSRESFEEYAKALKKRVEEGRKIVDFITVDGGDGGSGTAPLEMMNRIGLSVQQALVVVNSVLNQYGLREKIKIIASEKVLTPDDVVELLCYGADFVNIARGFMISAGCIRARECAGANGRSCPVGLATMDESKRSKYLVIEKSHHIANYHHALLEGVRSLLAVMGKNDVNELGMEDLNFRGSSEYK